MCILCVVQRWSRRIATMLPWLVIPLIGLWALSQLLPPGYRFEVTSPRLACVLVLLVTLFWYEILMPQLSAWRARRSARLREKRRFEAMEMHKLRKTATRRCRNCLTPYRDQNPGGGRFMCSYCGHISRRPVLEMPGVLGCRSIEGIAGSGIIGELVGKSGKIWNGKMWLDNKPGWSGGNGWMCSQSLSSDWPENGNWVGGSGSFSGRSTYWGKNGGMFFSSDDRCLAEKSYCGLVFFVCKLLTTFFLGIRWVWRKIFRVSSAREDSSLDADHRGASKKGENGLNFQESKGEKARRKAEEKRQARLEKEMLEEEERKQREEVARLVEERRRLRDEKLEAEKERGKGSAPERDKKNKKEKETERKRQEKTREKEKGSNNDKSNSDVDELERRSTRESERKRDFDKKSEIERPDTQKISMNNAVESTRSSTENYRFHNSDMGHGIKGAMNNISKGGASRYFDRMKGSFLSSSRALNGTNITPFFGKGGHASAASVMKATKPTNSGDHVQASASVSPAASASSFSKNTTASVWDGMPRTKAWGEGIGIGSEVLPRKSNASSNSSSGDSTEHRTGKSTVNGDEKSYDSTFQRHVGSELKLCPQAVTQKKSWHQLFTRSPAVPSSSNPKTECQLSQKHQAEVQSPCLTDQTSPAYSLDGQIHFGLSLPFTNSPLTTGPMGSITVPVSATESIFFPVGEPVHDLLAEEVELFDSPSYVPDPVSLLGPVSESLDNFPLDLGTGFLPNTGQGKSRVLKNISAPIEATRPSPIESPISRSLPQRVTDDGQHASVTELWDSASSPLGESTNAQGQGTWQMWGTLPLGQDGLGLVSGPSSWILPLANNISNQENILCPPTQRTGISQFAVENQVVPCNHSPLKIHAGDSQNGGTFSTPDPGLNDSDPWLQNIFPPLSGDGDSHFVPLNLRDDISPTHNEATYDDLNRSVANPFELSAPNCWTKSDWRGQSAREGVGSAAAVTRPHIGGLFSNPDVQSLWSFK